MYKRQGIDYSEEMLELAAGKRAESGQDILYLCQDMREFELYGTVRAVVSICDCINYITDPADLAEVFSLVNNYLDPGGVFIFDLNTEYKYAQVMGDTLSLIHIFCDGESMLIDGGNSEDSDVIYTYLEKQKVEELDYMVCTHAHEDHVGGLSGALTYASVDTALAPVTEYDSRAFRNFLEGLEKLSLIHI